MNGRTYCGFYRGHYLKSTLEYIYARYLDYMGIAWDYEVQVFSLSNGGSYKPDFRLSETEFVEIKGTFNYELDKPRVDLFSSDYGYTVKVLQEKDLRLLIKPTPFVFEHLKQEWKTQAICLGMDTSGRNNPRYGAVMSELTKQKISLKAKKRMADPSYREKWEPRNSAWSKSEKNVTRLREFNKARQQTVFSTCQCCGREFELLYRKSDSRNFCSYKCSAQVLFSKANHKETLLSIACQYALDNKDAILTCKLNKIKPVLQEFYKIVAEQTSIKDDRTISLYLLGKTSNRKDLLRFFQSLAENVLGASVNKEAEELEDKELLG